MSEWIPGTKTDKGWWICLRCETADANVKESTKYHDLHSQCVEALLEEYKEFVDRLGDNLKASEAVNERIERALDAERKKVRELEQKYGDYNQILDTERKKVRELRAALRDAEKAIQIYEEEQIEADSCEGGVCMMGGGDNMDMICCDKHARGK